MLTRSEPSPAAVNAPYVLPTRTPPAARPADLVVVAPDPHAGSAFRRGSEVAKALGERFLGAAENQRVFAAELRQRLEAVDAAIPEATRAQLKGLLRAAIDVLGWCDAAQDDLLDQSRRAAAGAEPIDVAALCADVASADADPTRPVHVLAGAAPTWWGHAAPLAAAVRAALQLVSERAPGRGARSIDVSETSAAVLVEFAAAGEAEDVDPAAVARFRRAAAAVGAAVLPTALGAAAPGLVLSLPKPQVAEA